jgi:hypothetical protein
MNNKPIVHIIPTRDIKTNHSKHSSCPCKPKKSERLAFGKDSIVYIHKYTDNHEYVKEWCFGLGINLERDSLKTVIINEQR